MDKTGNVLIQVPATAGREKAPTVVLQGHLDMVCEKNADVEFDFLKDPIELVREGDWLTAGGTTLGADNGVGVAIALAFMELEDVAHGPLELLFTVNEETGLNGARALEPDFVQGRLLFNLDSEEDGVFYVGCAGGKDATITLPLKPASGAEPPLCWRLEIKGLLGGHSGLDIIHNRGNAVRLLARALWALGQQIEYQLVSFNGGDKHNAIPREATALIVLPGEKSEEAKKILQDKLSRFREEFATAEPELELVIGPGEKTGAALSRAATSAAIDLLLGLPHGVQAMDRNMPGMVETSTNLARVRTTDSGELTALLASRSSVASALDGLVNQIAAVGRLAGGTVDLGEGYPGWQPNMKSVLLAKAGKVWQEVHGEEARFEVIHAGLECGIIGEKYPGMDMISLGPTIQAPHSPNERVSLGTVERLFEFTKAFLQAMD
jgi:dipeptidase D